MHCYTFYIIFVDELIAIYLIYLYTCNVAGNIFKFYLGNLVNDRVI